MDMKCIEFPNYLRFSLHIRFKSMIQRANGFICFLPGFMRKKKQLMIPLAQSNMFMQNLIIR